jgi:hypothetical protein
MSLHHPTVLKESICAFVVSQIYTFTCVAYNITSTRISVGAVSDKPLEIGNVVRCDCEIDKQ